MLKAISNTSPLLYLYRIGGIEWLPKIFDKVWTPANCNYIITYNVTDFKGIEKFGIKAITPKEFLELVGEL